MWGNQFILGHELGHAVIHQLGLPLTGLEEDFGRRLRHLLHRQRQGHRAECCPRRRRALRCHGQQEAQPDPGGLLQRPRCHPAAGLQLPLRRPWGAIRSGSSFSVADGYIPEFRRATLCGKEWTQLNYGWWTVLEPDLTPSYKKKRDGVCPPTGSPEPRRREQRAVRQAQADARPAVRPRIDTNNINVAFWWNALSSTRWQRTRAVAA